MPFDIDDNPGPMHQCLMVSVKGTVKEVFLYINILNCLSLSP